MVAGQSWRNNIQIQVPIHAGVRRWLQPVRAPERASVSRQQADAEAMTDRGYHREYGSQGAGHLQLLVYEKVRPPMRKQLPYILKNCFRTTDKPTSAKFRVRRRGGTAECRGGCSFAGAAAASNPTCLT
jgi:hypothetical protein